ncbi:helicase associated domain-containing protein, partial [Roseivivax marinus]|uniref:helicase associated domain-containing protein n=1 Tax=Roseivivax marinus TaxID=1379903 RepID=UPI001969AB33
SRRSVSGSAICQHDLIKYKEEHGDCDVPQNRSTHKSLGIWVARQRRSYDRGELPKDRIDRLEALGFAWDVLSKIWEARFSELCRYKSKHGDCNVPRHWKENRHHGYWVNTQRIDYKEGILPEDKVKRLEALGFHWSPSRDRWEKMFLELAEYQKIHGTCIVPRKLTGNSELANWVGTQRRKMRMGSLPSHLVSRLDDLGFSWDRFEEAWEAKFQQSKAYKSTNGNCNVPIEHPEHSSLGSWVSDQRKRFKQGKLSEKRRKKLCSIGFRF